MLARQCPAKHIDQMTPLDVQAVCASWRANLEPTTRWGYHHHLRKIVAQIGRPDLATFVDRVAPPQPREVTATAEEREAILEHAPPALRLLVLLCNDCALRVGTALKLSPQHYDPETQTFATATKRGQKVMMPVTQEIARIIDTLPNGRSEPFCTILYQGRGSEFSKAAAWREFQKAKLKAHITRKLTFHDLRRTAAHNAYNLTGDLRIVQQLLGHQNIDSTLHYLNYRLTPLGQELLEEIALQGQKR